MLRQPYKSGIRADLAVFGLDFTGRRRLNIVE